LAGLAVVLGWGASLHAATQDGPLRVEVCSGYNLIVDSNAGSPSSYAPGAAYIGVTLHNDGTTDLTDIVACVGNYNDGASPTPGTYPSRVHPGLTGPLDGGAFALRHEGGRAGLDDATRYIGTIPAGESVTVYWLVGYDQLDKNGTPLWGASVKPDDDLWLEYDVWATASEGSTTRTVDLTRELNFRNTISASANKIFPNGANKVPDYYKDLLNQYVPAWTNANYDGTVGTRVVTEGIWYDLGVVGEGFDNNGDMVPDRNIWMQPVGDPRIFDASAFRLVKTYAMVIVKLTSGSELVLTGEDQLYFENIPENNGVVGYVRYEFMPLVPNACSVTTPYQVVGSNPDREKFNADFGVSLSEGLQSGGTQVGIDKTADSKTILPGGMIRYAVAYTNAGSVAVGTPGIGLPLVVQDSIPDGTTYVSGSATASNTLPEGVSAYTVFYSTDNGATWTQAEPNAASVTDIQWWLSDVLSAGSDGVVRFSVTVDSPYIETEPIVVNEAGLSYGNTLPFATDDAITFVQGNNSLGDTVFADTGEGGGILGNGIQDGTEVGIAGISVLLYHDINGNGVVDASDSIHGLAITDADGKYLFANLPDGNYVVVLDHDDTDLPEGYTTTTPLFYAIDLDSARTDPNGVEDLTADFGVAPALTATKTCIGTGTLREGGQVTYQIAVTNRLTGSGASTPQPLIHTIWPTNGYTEVGNKGWFNAANAWTPGEPDGTYATAPFEDTSDELNLMGYADSAPRGVITNVTLVLPMRVNGSFVDTTSTLTITLWKNSTSLGSRTFNAVNLPTGILSVNVTDMQALWDWSDFNGTALRVQLIAKKQGNPTGTLDLDSVGFMLMTDQLVGGTDATTLNPVPLVDTYDTSRLAFVSASPPPDTVATNGLTGELGWNNLGPIYAGGERVINVTFDVLEPPGNISAPVTNTFAITNAWYETGKRANDQHGDCIVTVLPAGTIGDFVWRDLNGNGVQDPGEPGVADVTVTITPPAGVDLGYGVGVASNTVTDANGFYLFGCLPASGNYTVAVVPSTLPGGSGTPTWDYDGVSTPHQAVVPIIFDSTTGADTVLTADFGYSLLTTIRGTLWRDLDRDGSSTPEAGDDWLAGVTVQLRDSGGTVIATTATGPQGTYQFAGDYSGTYTVTVVTNSGPLATGTWSGTYDTDGLATANAVAVTVALGGVDYADFSYAQSGTLAIGDTIFYDWNGNGTQDAEDEGVSGVTVRLYQDEDGDGEIDAGIDAFVAATVTDVDGGYLFESLPPGTYQVIVDTSTGQQSYYVVTADPDSKKDGISVVTLTTSDNLDQDFGFLASGYGSIGDTVWCDGDADGMRLSAVEYGFPDVTVWLYADLNGDGSYVLAQTTTTDADGHYLFASLLPGAYRVVVDAASPALPVNGLGESSRPTTPTSYDITIEGAAAHLDADFGFVLPGAIGDTVWWDYNGNADQDWNEPGIPGVTVRLYRDVNANGVYDAGEELIGTLETDTDGKYMFRNLMPDYYVVVVDETSAPLAAAVLTGDPDNDGVPCPVPAVAGPSCDGQYGLKLTQQATFTGADFGYQPPGVIGDTLWIDVNTNGVRDIGEPGIPYVTVALYHNETLIATQETDADGIYLFGGLADGTYKIVVDAADPDLHTGLVPVYDADGVADGVATNIVISGGSVISIGGHSVTNADLDIDFGYHFSGTNVVSGTVGLDTEPFDGLLNGMNTSGVGAGEYPFADVTVYLYLWNDDGDDVIESGETLMIASTTTDAAGDYHFEGLPSGSANDRYIVSLAAPVSGVRLTTKTYDTSALTVVNTTNSLGHTRSAYQTMTIVSVRDNIDFAFDPVYERDFGDLPSSYSTTLADNPVGPSHTQVPGQPLYLGRKVETERNGTPTPDATGDGDEEDGVEVVGRWSVEHGGQIEVLVGAGSGWLCGWIDFNQDGTFTNANELAISQAVDSQGTGVVYTLGFPIPEGTFRTNGVTVLNTRFRLYPSQPLIPLFSGEVKGGEVEDHQFTFGAIGDRTWYDANNNGLQDADETALTNVTVQIFSADDTLLGTEVTDADGRYLFTGLPAGTYYLTFSAPTNYLPTTPRVGEDRSLDSDIDPQTGRSDPITLATGEMMNRTVDAGFVMSAVVNGYVFVDTINDMLFDTNTNDQPITNVLVSLVVDGKVFASTNTDANGCYKFGAVPPGVVSVLVSRAGSELVGIPTEGDVAYGDERRNRAVDAGEDAVIVHTVLSGAGVLDGRPSETLNFGFENHPLSTAIDIRLYATPDGVMIQLWTVNEAGCGDIVIYAWIDNAWGEVGRVPAWLVVGEGANDYTVAANGLAAGGAYYLKVIDEVGNVHLSLTPVAVDALQVDAVKLDLQYVTLRFNTESGRSYQVEVSTDLVTWRTEYVSAPTAKGWTAFTTEPFMAGADTHTEVRVPRNGRARAFFKIKCVER